MMCSRVGCQLFATKRPVWSFAAKVGPDQPRAELLFGLGVCDAHATPDAFLPVEETWKRIEDEMRAAGRAAPERSTFHLDYVPFDAIDSAVQKLFGGAATVH